ncbi:uncharacterized protein MONBRDRAFT_32093 [Monosiga brevicollis MX1]|uniref:Uncharacterized protein n=1 Tax=Monosiga brevicollis TaxID=81824 RepID=A9UXD6_MONBE|nr:uncharacterized protein MONBRDRAFT_32093 [Monosiga brevicollis MX1]EDQ90371.1 predicted protein [Monosiga brevicollis MX1]|eukprot:XP_001745138.1 hypothetical protein [Monosiga brevicollis MX1]
MIWAVYVAPLILAVIPTVLFLCVRKRRSYEPRGGSKASHNVHLSRYEVTLHDVSVSPSDVERSMLHDTNVDMIQQYEDSRRSSIISPLASFRFPHSPQPDEDRDGREVSINMAEESQGEVSIRVLDGRSTDAFERRTSAQNDKAPDNDDERALGGTESYREASDMASKPLPPHDHSEVDEEGFTIIPQHSQAASSKKDDDQFYSSDDDSDTEQRSKWSRLTIKDRASSTDTASEADISRQMRSMSASMHTPVDTNRRSRASTVMDRPPSSANESFAAFGQSPTESEDVATPARGQSAVIDFFSTPIASSADPDRKRAFEPMLSPIVASANTVDDPEASALFDDDDFGAGAGQEFAEPDDLNDSTPALLLSPAAAAAVARRNPGANDGSFLLADAQVLPVPSPPPSGAVAAVKAALRDLNIKLWLLPHSHENGTSGVTMELVDEVASATGLDVEVAGETIEYLRVVTYNKKLSALQADASA